MAIISSINIKNQTTGVTEEYEIQDIDHESMNTAINENTNSIKTNAAAIEELQKNNPIVELKTTITPHVFQTDELGDINNSANTISISETTSEGTENNVIETPEYYNQLIGLKNTDEAISGMITEKWSHFENGAYTVSDYDLSLFHIQEITLKQTAAEEFAGGLTIYTYNLSNIPENTIPLIISITNVNSTNDYFYSLTNNNISVISDNDSLNVITVNILYIPI